MLGSILFLLVKALGLQKQEYWGLSLITPYSLHFATLKGLNVNIELCVYPYLKMILAIYFACLEMQNHVVSIKQARGVKEKSITDCMKRMFCSFTQDIWLLCLGMV